MWVQNYVGHLRRSQTEWSEAKMMREREIVPGPWRMTVSVLLVVEKVPEKDVDVRFHPPTVLI